MLHFGMRYLPCKAAGRKGSCGSYLFLLGLLRFWRGRELPFVLPLLVAVVLLAFEWAACALRRKARLMPAHLSVGCLVLLKLLLSEAKAAILWKNTGLCLHNVCLSQRNPRHLEILCRNPYRDKHKCIPTRQPFLTSSPSLKNHLKAANKAVSLQPREEASEART